MPGDDCGDVRRLYWELVCLHGVVRTLVSVPSLALALSVPWCSPLLRVGDLVAVLSWHSGQSICTTYSVHVYVSTRIRSYLRHHNLFYVSDASVRVRVCTGLPRTVLSWLRCFCQSIGSVLLEAVTFILKATSIASSQQLVDLRLVSRISLLKLVSTLIFFRVVPNPVDELFRP